MRHLPEENNIILITSDHLLPLHGVPPEQNCVVYICIPEVRPLGT